MSSFARSDSNTIIEGRKITTRLSKDARREVLLLKWASFIEGLQLIQKDVLTISYDIFVVEALQNFHSDISKTLKECTSTCLGSVAMRSHTEKLFHERRPLWRMNKSILKAVSAILTDTERDLSLSVLRIDFSQGVFIAVEWISYER